MKGLILSGGHGTRLRPLTYSQQKQLIPVANKPIIFYPIEDIVETGVKEIGIVIGPNREQITDIVGDGSRWGIKIEYIEQPEPLGLAHAVKISRDFLGDDDFVMYLGDNLLKGGIVKHVEKFNKSDASASILLCEVDNPQQFGVAELNKDGSIKKLVEKPKEPPSNLALAGIYLFKPEIFEAIGNINLSWRNELEITDAIQYLIDKESRVDSAIVEDWWKDTGKPKDILEANQLVLDEMEPSNEGKVEDGADISGKVTIGKGTVIKEKAKIKGPAIIGEDCEIGPDAYIGPYTSIGNNSKIENAEIEYSVILDNATIRCREKIVDSLIGRDVKIHGREKLPKGHKLVVGDHSEVEL